MSSRFGACETGLTMARPQEIYLEVQARSTLRARRARSNRARRRRRSRTIRRGRRGGWSQASTSCAPPPAVGGGARAEARVRAVQARFPAISLPLQRGTSVARGPGVAATREAEGAGDRGRIEDN